MSARPDPHEDGVVGNRLAKKRRTDDEPIEMDGPIEDEETARQKLERAGFDPDNLAEAHPTLNDGMREGSWAATLMAYFCYHGDLPLCRYLFVHGAAETVSSSRGFWFPMLAAAWQSHVDICQWLFKHGAADDIREPNNYYITPLRAVSEFGKGKNRMKMCQWLIMNGALADPTSENRRFMINHSFPAPYQGTVDIRPELLLWVKDAMHVHATFRSTFLMGTKSPPEFSVPALLRLLATKLGSEEAATEIMEDNSLVKNRCIWDKLVPKHFSPLRCFSGLPGILELVADFAGVMHGRDLRTVRELADVLETLIRERPALIASDGSDDSDSSADVADGGDGSNSDGSNDSD